MTSIFENLLLRKTWDEFLEYKLTHQYMSRKEKEQLSSFIEEERYIPIATRLSQRDYYLDLPLRRTINKSGTTKKRTVYTFSEEENLFLKGLSFQLYHYDPLLSDRCYSFRRSHSARNAIFDILAQKNKDSLFCFKADISNYFNSIPEEKLLSVLEELIHDDPDLLWFFRCLLLAGKSRLSDGSVIPESRGAMAGTPVSPFFANVYLLSVDREFEEKGISYFRYSDDILIFAESREELEDAIRLFTSRIEEKGLVLNPSKMHISTPGEPWEFLGFSYQDHQVDISSVTKEKLKGKIRRKARALLRWKTQKDAGYERAARALIRTFNRKFYNELREDLFTWSRWFFPVITTDKTLRELDSYLIEYIRYLYSGRHYKGNYAVTYDQIKEMGFRSLRHEYYLSRTENALA